MNIRDKVLYGLFNDTFSTHKLYSVK